MAAFSVTLLIFLIIFIVLTQRVIIRISNIPTLSVKLSFILAAISFPQKNKKSKSNEEPNKSPRLFFKYFSLLSDIIDKSEIVVRQLSISLLNKESAPLTAATDPLIYAFLVYISAKAPILIIENGATDARDHNKALVFDITLKITFIRLLIILAPMLFSYVGSKRKRKEKQSV